MNFQAIDIFVFRNNFNIPSVHLSEIIGDCYNFECFLFADEVKCDHNNVKSFSSLIQLVNIYINENYGLISRKVCLSVYSKFVSLIFKIESIVWTLRLSNLWSKKNKSLNCHYSITHSVSVASVTRKFARFFGEIALSYDYLFKINN